MNLQTFVAESNRIEGIELTTGEHLTAHKRFIRSQTATVAAGERSGYTR